MVAVSHKIGVDDSLIDNMYNNYGHTPQRIDEDEATNVAEKLILKFCELHNVRLLVCHGNGVRLVVVGDIRNIQYVLSKQKSTMPVELTIIITRVFRLRARSTVRDDMIQNIIGEFISSHMISNGIEKSCGISCH